MTGIQKPQSEDLENTILACQHKNFLNRNWLPVKIPNILHWYNWCPTQVMLSKEICLAAFFALKAVDTIGNYSKYFWHKTLLEIKHLKAYNFV